MLEDARTRREQNTKRNVTMDELTQLMEGLGAFAYREFRGAEACELRIKERTQATIRVLPDREFQTDPAPNRCVYGQDAVTEAVWAKAY